jgi:5-methylthioribose kinase
MTRPFSIAYKQKVVERLTGKDAVSASQLSRETGVRQQTMSRWLEEARSLPLMASEKLKKTWSVDEKVRVLSEAARLTGPGLTTFLEKEGVSLGTLEQWRMALDEEGRASVGTAKRIRKLERELARKEKALAEAAALLVLKKKLSDFYGVDEDDDTDEEKGK